MDITTLFILLGVLSGEEYLQEDISQGDHAWGTYRNLLSKGISEDIALAGLFHDIGHVPMVFRKNPYKYYSIYQGREIAGVMRLIDWLYDKPKIITVNNLEYGLRHHAAISKDLILWAGLSHRTAYVAGQHVNAKRYIVEKYGNSYRLSHASQMTLLHQGGPMAAHEAKSYEYNPEFEYIIMLRRAEDFSKE
jgi:predicted HD phosphohydrolase